MNQLSNVWLQVAAKLQRASSLIADLEVDSRAHIEQEHLRLIPERVRDSNVWRLWLQGSPEVPLSFGVLVGDIIHNLRSALDVATVGVLKSTFSDAYSDLTKWQKLSLHFPIYDEEDRYAKGKWHQGVANDSLVELLRTVQPFYTWGETLDSETVEALLNGSDLHLLRELSNADKHREIALTVTALDVFAIGLPKGHESKILKAAPWPWAPGSTLFEIQIDGPVALTTPEFHSWFAIALPQDVHPLRAWGLTDRLRSIQGHVWSTVETMKDWCGREALNRPQRSSSIQRGV